MASAVSPPALTGSAFWVSRGHKQQGKAMVQLDVYVETVVAQVDLKPYVFHHSILLKGLYCSTVQ